MWKRLISLNLVLLLLLCLLPAGVSAAGNETLVWRMPSIIYKDDGSVFYDSSNTKDIMLKLGVLAIEMEASTLYLNAAEAGKQALCICTISDNPITGEELDAQERQLSFTHMMELALEIA